MTQLRPVFLLIVALSATSAWAADSIQTASAITPDDIAQRLQVTENKTIFTLFALLNIAGYDDENSDAGMHPARRRIREALEHSIAAELRARLQAFYRERAATADAYHYAVVSMCTDGPPNFTFTAEWGEARADSEFAALEDLPELLREFTRGVPLDSLYNLVRSDYTAYIELYNSAILREAAKVMAYCRLTDANDLSGHGEVERMIVVPNLLESYHKAFSFFLGGAFWSIEGPQRAIGYNPHEFVHSITNAVSYDSQYTSLQSRAEPLFALAETVEGIKGEFSSLAAFCDENLVRAVSIRYLVGRSPKRDSALFRAMLEEYRGGLTLERHFYEQLSDYEKSGRPLREYYPELLRNLDVMRESKRWEDEQGAQ